MRIRGRVMITHPRSKVYREGTHGLSVRGR
jgi:hypothetical protein